MYRGYIGVLEKKMETTMRTFGTVRLDSLRLGVLRNCMGPVLLSMTLGDAV